MSSSVIPDLLNYGNWGIILQEFLKLRKMLLKLSYMMHNYTLIITGSAHSLIFLSIHDDHVCSR